MMNVIFLDFGIYDHTIIWMQSRYTDCFTQLSDEKYTYMACVSTKSLNLWVSNTNTQGFKYCTLAYTSRLTLDRARSGYWLQINSDHSF